MTKNKFNMDVEYKGNLHCIDCDESVYGIFRGALALGDSEVIRGAVPYITKSNYKGVVMLLDPRKYMYMFEKLNNNSILTRRIADALLHFVDDSDVADIRYMIISAIKLKFSMTHIEIFDGLWTESCKYSGELQDKETIKQLYKEVIAIDRTRFLFGIGEPENIGDCSDRDIIIQVVRTGVK